MVKKRSLRKFIKAIKDYSEGKSPEGLRVYIIDCKYRKIREIIDLKNATL